MPFKCGGKNTCAGVSKWKKKQMKGGKNEDNSHIFKIHMGKNPPHRSIFNNLILETKKSFSGRKIKQPPRFLYLWINSLNLWAWDKGWEGGERREQGGD